jgi:PAB-dependent poly(A)-specific ribonuclease subunit 2
VCCGGSNGELTIHDPNSLRIIQSLQAHSGGINDIAINNDLLVTCGWSQRAGQMFVDSMLRVYDLRTYRQLTPISFPAGACFLQFMPKLSSTLMIASQSGQFQLIDISVCCKPYA